MDKYFLKLSSNVIVFEAASKIVDVFFDDCNAQVFTIRTGGATGVMVRGTSANLNHSFCMQDNGLITAIKFSPDQRILAKQHSPKSVEFHNIDGSGIDKFEYSVTAKQRNVSIHGFIWTTSSSILLITENSLDHYAVNSCKKSCKLLKTFSQTVYWYVYANEDTPASGYLLVLSNEHSRFIQTYYIKNGQITKLSKFEVRTSSITSSSQSSFQLKSSVYLLYFYSQMHVAIIKRHSSIYSMDVLLYPLQKDIVHTCTLRLPGLGVFFPSVVDNLVVVHYQDVRRSIIFDTQSPPADEENGIKFFEPVVPPKPIAPVAPPSELDPERQWRKDYSYPLSWSIFRPDIIIDPTFGVYWTIELLLDSFSGNLCSSNDPTPTIRFLLRRKNSKSVILRLFQDALDPTKKTHTNLDVISNMFDVINEAYRNFHDFMQTESSTCGYISNTAFVEQYDMYGLLYHFAEAATEHPPSEAHFNYVDVRFAIGVLSEYIRSLSVNHITVQHYINEVLIQLLVRSNRLYQLHQYLQYHVFADSKPMACLLLSLQGSYPAAFQLALDMLKRLDAAHEEIVEVLLSQQRVVAALKVIRSKGRFDSASAGKFLEASMHDNRVFFSVFRAFEERNIRLYNSAAFPPSDNCSKYVTHFVNQFGKSALLESHHDSSKRQLKGFIIL